MKRKLANSTHHPSCRACRVPFTLLRLSRDQYWSCSRLNYCLLIPFFACLLYTKAQKCEKLPRNRLVRTDRSRGQSGPGGSQRRGSGLSSRGQTVAAQLSERKKKNVQGRPPQQQQRGITIGVIHTGVSSFHSGVKFRQEFLHCLPITGVGIAVHFLLSWIGVRRPTKKVVLCGHVLIDLRNGTFIAVK